MHRQPQPVDVKRKLDEHVESTFANGDDHSSRRRFRSAVADIRQQSSTDGAMDDRKSAQDEIEKMFPDGISQQFVDQLLDRREARDIDIPIYGNAPRYAPAIVLATALAQATGGDAGRARNVINAWNLQSEADPTRFNDTVRADDLATQCLLAKTVTGWDILTALAPSRYVRLDDTDDRRRHMSTALRACAHLLENLPFDDGAFTRPQDLDDAFVLAREIVDQGMPAPNEDEPRPDTSLAYGFERNVIAARALMGSLCASPTPKQREAILLFKKNDGEQLDIGNVSMMRHRLNRMFSDNNEKRGLFGRMPTMNQRLMDTLAKRTMSELAEHLDAQLAPRMRMENGRLVPDPAFVVEPTPERMRTELHFAAIKLFINRVDHRSRRSSIDLKRGEFNGLLDTVASRLGMTPKALSRDSVWQEAHAECRQLDVDKLRAWMREANVDPATDDMGKHLRALDNMQQGKASNARGMRELVDTMRPGSSIAFTSRGATGPNITLWATIAPEAWKHKWGHPTFTPLPTGARIRGRGAAVVLSGDESPDGGYVDIDIGTFDRKSWTVLAGVVAQIHSENPMGAMDKFWWQVFEYGWHGSKETSEGLKLRITADTFDEAKRRASKVLETISGVTPSDESDGEDRDGWDSLVDEYYDEDYISVHRQTREEKLEKGRIAQTMTVLGENPPFGANAAIPENGWIAGGVNSWWNAFAMQFSRTKGTLTSRTRGANDITQTSTRREQHTTLGGLTYPQPSTVPVKNLGSAWNGGVGAAWIPMKRFTKGLESGDVMLHLPPPGSNDTPYQEWAMTELEYIEWQTELWGASSPTPPEHIRNHILPDRPKSARGQLMVVVRRYPTPKAAGCLRANFDSIETMSGNASAGPAIRRKMDDSGALLQAESTWGDPVVSYEYTKQHENVTGLPPFVYQRQHFVGTIERDRQHVLGRTGGRNTISGTRVPEKYVPDTENRRIFNRNLPTRFAPALPGAQQSPMQQLIRDIFANYPQEWIPRDPVVLPSHMDQFGHLFHLLQMREEVYPSDSPILKELQDYLGTSDGMAVVDCTPKRDPAKIMKDFEIERERYVVRQWPVDQRVPDNIDEIRDDAFWSKFDIATFFKENFDRPNRPLAVNPPARQNTLQAHVEAYGTANRLDMSNREPHSSMIPLPRTANVPSNRFILQFGWDELPTAQGRLARGTPESVESVLSTIRNKQHLIDELGHDPNANGTHFTGRAQPLTLALIAESYANHTGNDDILVEILPQLMAEIRSALRGADELLPGQIFNGVAMLPDGRIQLAPHDYAAPKGARPESYREDTHESRHEHKRLGINPAFTLMHKRAGAATGIDYSDAQLNPNDGSPELPYMLPLQQGAHFVRALAVAERALHAATQRGAAGTGEMAGMIGQLRAQWIAAMQATFLVERDDVKLTRGPNGRPAAAALTVGGAYFRLKEGKLHPARSAEIANALWAGIVPPEAMEGTIRELKELITPAGIKASDLVDSAQQWDGENYWAMHAYKAVEGLLLNNQEALAREVAIAYCKNAWEAFCIDGKTAEKFGPNGTYGGGGEYSVEFNMTMTNEILAYFGSLFPECAEILARPVPQKVAA